MSDTTLVSNAEIALPAPVRKVAAVDLGSNSFHLVVARIVAEDVQVLHQLKTRVRLAEGLDEDGWLSAEAIARGLDHLQSMAESLLDFEPDQVRVVATYTLRKARNASEFVKAAQRILPYPVEVISGSEEARLIYLGVAHTNYHEGNRLVIDIGGGSTELVVGEGFDPKVMFSLPMGCVTLTRRFFADGRITAKRMNKAVRRARQEIEGVSNALQKHGWEHCIGSSGTIQAIMSCASELDDSQQANRVTQDNLKSLAQHCIEQGRAEALTFSGVSDDRRDVFAAGLAILIGLFESLGIESIEYSSGALREGVLYDMEESLAHRDIRDRTAQSLVTRYVVDLDQARRVEDTAMDLFAQVGEQWKINSQELGHLLAWAAMLHEVGLQINSKDVHKHSAYILRNIDMPGFNQEQQELLALLVRFQRKKIRKEEFRIFLIYAPPEITRLIVLLRLSVLLHFKRQDGILPAMELRAKGSDVSLRLDAQWLEGKPVFQGNLEQERRYLEALDIRLKIC